MNLPGETEAILADLIAFPTVSADSNLALIAYAAERLETAGARLEFMHDATGTKANLFATIGPDAPHGIVLSGHTDVVPVLGQNWTSDPFTMRKADGRLYGRGACDMKGFIAATLAMAPAYAAAKLKRPVHFAFTYDEETGCLGGRHLTGQLQNLGIRPAAAIIGEPTGMRIIEGHKGCFEYTTTFRGLPGHCSRPDLGVNAIEYAVRYIARLMQLADELQKSPPPGSRFEPPWTTLQTGQIRGGTARNVIAAQCAVEWEMRPVSDDDAHMVKADLEAYCRDVLLPAMRAVCPDASITTETIGEVAGLVPATVNEARDIVSALTGQDTAGIVSFGTEAGLFQEQGIATVICGPGSIEQAHKPDEFVAISQLQACLDMLEGLKVRLADQTNLEQVT